MAYGNIKGITIEIDGDTSKLTTALRNVDSEARNVNRALKDINKAMKYDKNNGAELAAQKQKELARAIENTKKKIDTLKQGQANMTDEFKKTDEGSRAYDSLSREISKAERELKYFETQSDRTYQILTKIRDKATEFGDSLTNVGSNLTKKLTAPLIAAGTGATKLAADFDTAMVGVRKTTDLTDQEFQTMKKSILDMSKTMPATAVEIANVAESAGQLGIEKENILSFSKTIIDLGNSTDLTADQAASAFARFANITGMPQSEFENLGSVVVDLGNNLATTEPEIVEMGLKLAGAGSQAGLTYGEIMGLAGALSSVGISAEAGGSAMSQVMVKIGKSVSANDEKLQTFAKVAGMSAEEFATAWKTSPAEALTSFVEGLKNAGDSGENVDNILTDLGITGLRETDALKRLSGAGDLLGKSFDMANNAFEENTALSEEAQQKYKSFEAKLETFKNKVVAVGIAIGEKLMPYVEKMTDGLGKFADAISNADPRTVGIIVGIGAFLAALGPILMLVGKVLKLIGTVSGALAVMSGGITSGATPAMIGLAKVFGIVKSGFVALSGIIMAHPLVAAIVAIAAVLIPLIIKNWDTIKEFLINTWNSIKEIAINVWTGICEFFSNIWNGVKEAWIAFWTPIGEWLGSMINNIVTTIQPYVETFINFFQMMWMFIQEIFTTSWEVISGLMIQLFNAFIQIVIAIFTPIKDFFVGLWESVKEIFLTVWTAIKDTVTQIWQSLVDFATPIFNSIQSIVSSVWNTISSITSSVWQSISAVTTSVWNGIKSFLSGLWEGIKGIVNNAISFIKSFISSAWNNIRSITTSVWNGIKSAIQGPINAARSVVSSVVNTIKSGVSSAWNSIRSITSSTWNAVKSAIANPINRARDLVSNAINRMKSILNINLPFPRIKLPHFSVSGRFSIKPPSVPHFSVSWYKKGAIFAKPTLFNTPYGMKGVGEAGAEAVLPIEKLDSIVASALRKNGIESDGGVVITGNTFNVREEKDIELIARELDKLINRRKRGVGLA